MADLVIGPSWPWIAWNVLAPALFQLVRALLFFGAVALIASAIGRVIGRAGRAHESRPDW